MRKAALGLAMFVGLAATIPPSPGYAADAGTYETSIEGDIWRGNLAVDVAGNAIAVASDLFRYRHVNGHWSQQYHLPGSLGAAQVAAGRAGMAVVVGHTSSDVAATIRRTDATWTTPYTLGPDPAGSASGIDVAANADGDYAVSWTQHGIGSPMSESRAYIAVRQRGGTWHRFGMGALGIGPTRVGIDAAGNVTLVRTVTSSIFDPARLVARHKPVDGPAGATFQVSRAGDNVGGFDQIIERTGRRTYAYQYGPPVHDQYAASRVLRQASIGGPLTQVWSNAASSMPSIAADGGRLRVAWIERPDPNAPPATKTQAFNPAAGTPVTITDAPTDPAFTGVAINRYGAGVLAVGTDAHFLPETTKVSPVTAGTVGPSDWLDDDGPNLDLIVGAHPLLGAGTQYFIGLDGVYDGPSSKDVFLVFHGQLP